MQSGSSRVTPGEQGQRRACQAEGTAGAKARGHGLDELEEQRKGQRDGLRAAPSNRRGTGVTYVQCYTS